MLKNIVVPLDGSSIAEVAVPYGVEVASRTGALLSLLFVHEPKEFRSENIIGCYLENMAEKLKKDAAVYLQQSGNKELKVQVKMLTGNPAEEIINFVESLPYCQIVMASHGQSGTNTRWALGSVAEKVIKTTSAPVGIIRAIGDQSAVHKPGHLNGILAPLDGSKESEVTLPFLKDMGIVLKANITFFEVIKTDSLFVNATVIQEREAARNAVAKYLEKIVKDFQSEGITAKYVVEESSDDAGTVINQYTLNNHMDAVVMATHGRSGARRWVFGSVANTVMMEGNTPLTLIKVRLNNEK